MQPRHTRINRIIMLATALITWIALGLQLYILVSNAGNFGLTRLGALGRFLAFYTILTNMLVAISLTSILINPEKAWGRFFSKRFVQAGIALYILVVGIVYNAVLRTLWQPTGPQKWADELLHVVVPFMFVCHWLVFVPKGSLKWVHSFLWLLYPALYLVYALARGMLTGFYPYPFINVTELGYYRVFYNAAGLLIGFIFGGLLFVGIDKIMNRAASHSLS